MTMHTEEIMAIFRATGALREGHFVLTSGRHSDQFFLMPHVFQYPAYAEHLCAGIAALFAEEAVQTVIGPATGGIVLAYEVARQLGIRRGGEGPRALFAEKTPEGGMALKRQWTLAKGERVLVVEDAITTGGSVQKTLDAIAPFGPQVVGVGAIADRSAGAVSFTAPVRSLVSLKVASWAPADCPLCQQGIPLTKPKA